MKPEVMRNFKKEHLKQNPNKNDSNEMNGIPQGSSVSAIYANVYMINFDKTLADYVKKHNGLYRRYSDDIICVVPFDQKDILDTLFFQLVSDHKIEISCNKTRRFHIINVQIQDILSKSNESPSKRKIIDYLGFSYDGNRIYQKLNNRLYLLKELYRLKGKIVGKKRFYKSFSHLGEADRKSLQNLREAGSVSMKHRNFFSYAYKASDVMNEKQIRHQVAKHWKHIRIFFNKLEK